MVATCGYKARHCKCQSDFPTSESAKRPRTKAAINNFRRCEARKGVSQTQQQNGVTSQGLTVLDNIRAKCQGYSLGMTPLDASVDVTGHTNALSVNDTTRCTPKYIINWYQSHPIFHSISLAHFLSFSFLCFFLSLSLLSLSLSLSLSLPLCFSLLICHIILGQSAPAEPENLSIWLSAAGFQRPATWRTTRSGNREIHPSRTARRCLATMGLNGSKWAQEPQGGMIVISLNTEHDHKSIQFITNLWWPVDSTAALPKKVYCSRVSSLKMVPPVFCLSGPTQSLAPSLWVLWQWGENGGKGGSFLIPRLHGQENQYRNPHANEISHPDQAAQGWPRQMRRATRSRPRFVQRVLQPSRYWRRRCLSHKAHDRMTFGAQGLRQSENADSR